MITETVLEMHYHKPLMDAFREVLGLGEKGKINFYKYSQQKECFVGFDQAYAVSDLNLDDFFNMLKESANSRNYALPDKFVGYFLQFKVVKTMQTRRKYTPINIRRIPHYRVKLDTTKNINTGSSQHELLYNLNSNPGAMVYYACPMIFDRSELYSIHVDLDTLRLADLNTCPSKFDDNDNHFIYYNDTVAEPIWCSDPVEGKGISGKQFVKNTAKLIQQMAPSESAQNLLKILTNVEGVGIKEEPKGFFDFEVPNILNFIAENLTIIHLPAE